MRNLSRGLLDAKNKADCEKAGGVWVEKDHKCGAIAHIPIPHVTQTNFVTLLIAYVVLLAEFV